MHALGPQPQLGFEGVPSVLARLIVEILTDNALTAVLYALECAVVIVADRKAKT